MKRTWIALAVVAILGCGALAWAQSDGPRGQRAEGRQGRQMRQGRQEGRQGDGEAGPVRMFLQGQLDRLMEAGSKLDLTDEQRQQIRSILESHKTEIQAVAKPILAARRELHQAVLAEPVSEEAIRAAGAKLGNAMADAGILAAKIRAEVAAVLTDEQKARIAEFRARRAEATDRVLNEKQAE